ncbi:MAG: hypothetical protein NVS9B15_04040 [Acidobacteriaceae bacterium]
MAVTHERLVQCAVEWLRRYRCGIVLSEQYCATGEVPDAIGWKRQCHSVVVECKVSRADFLADAAKPFRQATADGLGNERYYLVPEGLIALAELPKGWGLLQYGRREISVAAKASNRRMRTQAGLMKEMNLLLASLARVEVRIEPQRITEFLKWKNRLADYNGGILPREVKPERNPYHHPPSPNLI